MLKQRSLLINPFDFANPVVEKGTFFGREDEVRDLVYYLDYAAKSKRAIHLALVGSRAAGKTSFLNFSEISAKERNFCVVRVNLNEGDVATDLMFFRKLFHSIANACFEHGLYGDARVALICLILSYYQHTS